MKRFLIYFTLLFVITAVSCHKTNEPTLNDVRISIELDIEPEAGQPATKSTIEGSLTDFKVALYDGSGTLFSDVRIEVSVDRKKIYLEGLNDGSYTLVFFGVGNVNNPGSSEIRVPQTLGGNWFDSSAANSPADNEYFHASTPLTVSVGMAKIQKVILKRLSARVDLIPTDENGLWNGGTLTQAELTFSTGQIYTSHRADGQLSSPVSITNLDVLKNLSFYTLPATTQDKLSGVLSLKGIDNTGKPITFSYSFQVAIERNKVATIRPKFVSEDNQYGTIKVYEQNLSLPFVKRFFQDGDTYKSVKERSFKPKNPIAYRISGKNIIISNYVAATLRDVSVYISYGAEYFELAWFEKMNPFEEYTFEFDALPKSKLYRTEGGGVVMIEKLYQSNNALYRYSSGDAESNRTLQAINQIRWGATMFFRQEGADSIGNNSRALMLRPVHARLVASQGVNMGYLMTSDLWCDSMQRTRLHNDDNVTVDFNKQILPRLINPNPPADEGHLYVGTINPFHPSNANTLGLSWVGNGTMYLIHQYSMQSQFDEQNDVHARVTFHHEYGHVLGYSHNSNLTYGAMHTVTFWASNELVRTNRMPYCSKPDGIGSYSHFYTTIPTKAGKKPLYMTNPEM